jgi:hypothetical protein
LKAIHRLRVIAIVFNKPVTLAHSPIEVNEFGLMGLERYMVSPL